MILVRAKVGTHSVQVVLLREHKLVIGRVVHFRERAHGAKWQRAVIDDLRMDVLFLSLL